MKKKLCVFILLSLIIVSGCAHKVTRIGYQLDANFSQGNCDVIVLKSVDLSEQDYEVFGQIKLGDTRFSLDCDESTALNFLKNEACTLQANLVNITKEVSLGLDSCYRCEAEFIRLDMEREEIANLAIKTSEQIESDEENKKDSKQSNAFHVIGGTIGFIFGFTIVVD